MSLFPKIVECSFKNGVVWITVTFVSVVWTLILTAPIHSRGSICDQLMLYWIFPNVFTWRNKLIYILDGLTFSANFRFGDNYSFNKIQQFSIENITWKVSFWYFTDVEKECWDGNQIHDHDSRKKHLQTDEVININSTTTLAGRSDIFPPHSVSMQIYHLYDFSVKSSVDPDPVAGWDDAVSGHWAEHDRAQFLPLLCEVERMNLSRKHSQDESQHRQQVHLPPKLKQTSWNNDQDCITGLYDILKYFQI